MLLLCVAQVIRFKVKQELYYNPLKNISKWSAIFSTKRFQPAVYIPIKVLLAQY